MALGDPDLDRGADPLGVAVRLRVGDTVVVPVGVAVGVVVGVADGVGVGLVVIGAILALVGSAGREIGGRRHWY